MEEKCYAAFKTREDAVRHYQKEWFGEDYIGASLARIPANGEIADKLIKFFKKPQYFLVYLGNPGCGKTYFCAAFAEIMVTRFNSARYYKEATLHQRLRKSINENKGDYNIELEYMIDDEVLILDDIGSTGPNAWREEILFNVVDYRTNRGLPTIFTSNFTKDYFRKNYHERLCSRLFAARNIIIEDFSGNDMRQLVEETK